MKVRVSKWGIWAVVIYLDIVLIVSWPFIIDREFQSPHFVALLLTSPFSWLFISTQTDVLTSIRPYNIHVGVLLACAMTNAAIIYFATYRLEKNWSATNGT